MARGFIDAVTGQQQLAEVARREALRAQVAIDNSQETSNKIGRQYAQIPWAQPGTNYSAAQANATAQTQKAIADASGRQAADLTDVHSPSKKSWWERNVYGKIKTASRWSFAAMQAVPDLVQNVSSDFLDSGPEQGGTGPFSSISGWWQSTKLGSMMSDSNLAGEGFFAGKELEELQGERARRYRGEVNGHAWTLGRGSISLVAPADSFAYKFLSGTVDAVVNLATDPLNAVGKAIKTGNIARNAIYVSKADASLAAKVAAGLATKNELAQWDTTSAVTFFNKNVKAQRLYKTIGETSDVEDILKLYKGNIPPEIAIRLADESDPEKIKALIIGAASKFGHMDSSDDAAKLIFGDMLPGIVPTSFSEMSGLKSFQGTRTLVQKAVIPKYVDRWFSDVPKSNVIIHGTVEQRTEAVKNYRNAIKQLGSKVTPEESKALINKFVRAYAKTGSSRDVYEAQGVYHDLIRSTLKAFDVPEKVIEETISGEAKLVGKLRAYFISAMGKHTDNGLLASLNDEGLVDTDTLLAIMKDKPVKIEELRFAGPTAYGDLLDRVHVLPDMRRIRRLTTSPLYRRTLQKAIATGDGKQNKLVEAVDFLQNEIWKTSALATVGYMFRNIVDGQLKMTLKHGGQLRKNFGGGGEEGISTLFNDPLGYLRWMGSRGISAKGRGDIMGELFKAGEMNSSGIAQMEYANQIGKAASSIDNQVNVLDNLSMSGDFVPVQYAPESAEAYITGTVQTLAHYRGDEIYRMVLEGKSDNDIMAFLFSDGGAEHRKFMLDNLKRGLPFSDENGIKYVDQNTGKQLYMPLKLDTPAEQNKALRLIINADYRKPVEHIVRDGIGVANMEELRLAMLTNHVGTGEMDTITGAALGAKKNGITPVSGSGVSYGGSWGVGTMFTRETPNGPRLFAIENVRIDPNTGDELFDIHYLYDEEAFVGNVNQGSATLRSLVNRLAGTVKDDGSTLMPRFTLHEKINEKPEGLNPIESWRKISSWFFNNVSAKAMAKFEKDPLFRQEYYKAVSENIDLLAPKEAQKVLDRITMAAQEEGISPENWATKRVIKSLQKQAASSSTEIVTARELSAYAGRIAGKRMGDVLFDASTKNNLEDAMRIAAPFGSAWREVMQKYIKILAEDPSAVLRAQRAYNGLTEATAFGDNGLFYKDPVTNEMTFTFPLSGELSKFVTGIKAPLAAPVKRLTMGFQVIPGLGPVGQFALNKILPDKPAFDEIANVFLPYGRGKQGESFVSSLVGAPQWLKKLGEAIKADPSKMDSMYATTYVDVMRALSATGKYNLDTEEGKQELLDDAKTKARWMVGFRAASQFIGPTAGSPIYSVETKQGDIYAGELVKEFQKMQKENYDGAVGNFINTFGEEVGLYISSKTRSIYGGLEATNEFANFERDNGNFFDAYKKTAGYFSPPGSEFSFAAWDRQIQTGKRERLTSREIIETAQKTIGSYKYRQLRLAFGSYPNELQRAWLKNQRQLISQQYPGFPATATFTVGQLDSFVAELRNAASNPAVQDQPVTAAINEYLDTRDQVLAAADANGVSLAQSKAAQPLRDYLMAKANALISITPEFSRVFDQKLAPEIED